jgi:hypothetical protein
MHWPPKHEDRAAWSAVGGVVTLAMASAAFVSTVWPVFAALALVGFYVCLAPLLGWRPWHQREESSPPTGITARHGIKAQGDIETDGRIEAGHGVEAGGNIQARPLNCVDLLREQYKSGKALQAAPLWVGGPAPASQHEAREGKTRKRERTYQWAHTTWKMLGEHFPGREAEFCPYENKWRHSDFFLAVDEEAVAMGSPDRYVEKKLVFLAELLRTYDS